VFAVFVLVSTAQLAQLAHEVTSRSLQVRHRRRSNCLRHQLGVVTYRLCDDILTSTLLHKKAPSGTKKVPIRCPKKRHPLRFQMAPQNLGADTAPFLWHPDGAIIRHPLAHGAVINHLLAPYTINGTLLIVLHKYY